MRRVLASSHRRAARTCSCTSARSRPRASRAWPRVIRSSSRSRAARKGCRRPTSARCSHLDATAGSSAVASHLRRGGTALAFRDVMPRPVWKGAIAFGLVTMPVGLYSATERAERLSFHLLHKKDNGRIDYKRVCEKDDREVPWSEIVKGYEYAKGKYVVLTDEDFDKAKTPGTQTFDIRAFVDADEIDSLYFETPYYLAPTGKATVKGYALLRDALEE